jgi:meiotically up-regulated gene 157 (Mug157) protein
MWAHSVDGRGGTERYVDARDLPLALAPLWGFCKPTLPAWRNTLRFAFDPANPGATEGPLAGLGSRQLPGTWTLGDIMGWVAFGLMGERRAADAALERLVGASFNDDMLPEAYDPGGSGSVVRHWFAWPGAALASLVLEHAARDAG